LEFLSTCSPLETNMPLQVSGVVTLLQVFDMPTSLQFYRDLLGFELIQRSQPVDQCGWAWLRKGDAEIMLNTAYEDADRPPAPDPKRQKAHEDTILFFGCSDLDGACTYLRSKGIDATEPKTAPYGMRQIWFRDPDHYGICFQWPTG
jgi:glyoxylase I family protein